MAAIDHINEAKLGLKLAGEKSGADDVSGRCSKGGAKAALATPNYQIPIIREWEYGEGSVIMFTMLDSCLGAVQVSGSNSVRGAHFAMWTTGDAQYDSADFEKAMTSAGFDESKPICYFGGFVAQWSSGLGQSIWLNSPPKETLEKDANQRAWIFEVKNGVFTHDKSLP